MTDAIAIYGAAQIIVVCDRDLNGVLDQTSFELHLDMATNEMNAYLLGRYPLPLASPPAYFKKLCVDIARYNATPTADTLTTEIKDRRDAAHAMMRDIAKNLIKLETGDQVTTANISATPQHRTGVQVFDAGARTFTECNLKSVL